MAVTALDASVRPIRYSVEVHEEDGTVLCTLIYLKYTGAYAERKEASFLGTITDDPTDLESPLNAMIATINA